VHSVTNETLLDGIPIFPPGKKLEVSFFPPREKREGYKRKIFTVGFGTAVQPFYLIFPSIKLNFNF
jgi:hypothetical protein